MSNIAGGGDPDIVDGGVLWVVATPIGNADDVTLRALSVLAGADLVAAEDTRRTGLLLSRHGIRTKLVSLHEHNEQARIPRILRTLCGGRQVALVSDAGTPLISDPGFRLVSAAVDAGVAVRPVPGASSITAALSVAALPTDRFVFEGFLPSRRSARRAVLERLRHEPRTVVALESAHRIVESLADLADIVDEARRMALARELTKRYETVLRGAIREVARTVAEQPEQRKGEFVLVIEGGAQAPPAGRPADDVLDALLAELPLKQAARLAAKITGEKKNALYQRALARR